MGKKLSVAFLLAGAILFAGSPMIRGQEANQSVNPPAQAAAADYGNYDANAYGSCGVGYSDVGCDVGCGDVGCDVGCYDEVGCGGCGYCDDCCYPCGGCGVIPFLSGVVSVALTPVHWMAELLSCGTFADCGCAPPYEPCYDNPCDTCGNYVGGGCGCDGSGYDSYNGYYSQIGKSGNTQFAQNARSQNNVYARNQFRANPSLMNQQVNEKADYLNYDMIETIGQKKARREYQQAKMMPRRQQVNMGRQAQGYVYEERVVSQERPMAVAQNHQVQVRSARPVQKTASNFNANRVNRNGRPVTAQYSRPLR